jgi:hypothetical protein
MKAFRNVTRVSQRARRWYGRRCSLGADTLQPAFSGFDRRLSPAARQRDRRRCPVCLAGIVLFLRRVAFDLAVGVAVIARNIVIPAVI